MTNFIKVKDNNKSSRQPIIDRKKLDLPLAHAGRSHASRKLREENRRILDKAKLHRYN